MKRLWKWQVKEKMNYCFHHTIKQHSWLLWTSASFTLIHPPLITPVIPLGFNLVKHLKSFKLIWWTFSIIQDPLDWATQPISSGNLWGQKSVNVASKWADGLRHQCVKIHPCGTQSSRRQSCASSIFTRIESTAAPGTSKRHEERWLLQGPAKIGAFQPTWLLSHRKYLPHKH